MLEFQEARQIAAAKYFAQAEAEGFEFEPWVADYGYENQDFFQVICGDKLWLVDGIEELAPVDDLMRLVNKKTGEFVETNALNNLNELDSFTPVGNVPKNFQ